MEHDTRLTGLWRHTEFLKLWSAQTISSAGTQITILAIPIIAVTALDATPFQMGLLTASLSLPSLLFGLLAGAWLDRRSRRPILIASDIGRAVLLLTVPLAHYLDLLSLRQLYIVAFCFGLLNLLFEVAYRAFLPSLVSRSQLVEGNSKLELSRAASELIGPGLGGLLIRIVSAPFALIVDAASYLVSAAFLQRIRVEDRIVDERRQSTLRADIHEGLIAIYRHPTLRAIAGCVWTIGVFNCALEAILILYIVSELDIGAGLLGLIFSAGGVGFLLGPFLVARLDRYVSARSMLVVGILVIGAGDLLVPLASGSRLAVVLTLVAGQFIFGVGVTTFSIVRISVQQAVTPDNLQGRTHATMTVLIGGATLAGGVAGGAVAELVGLRLTLGIAVAGELLSVLWFLRSSIDIRVHS